MSVQTNSPFPAMLAADEYLHTCGTNISWQLYLDRCDGDEDINSIFGPPAVNSRISITQANQPITTGKSITNDADIDTTHDFANLLHHQHRLFCWSFI